MSVRETLLIVDDMEINRAILSTIFENDYNVIEAENGEEAISLLEKNQSSIAAMLLDLVMPVKSGFEVMEEMERRGYFYNIPVLVITSDDSSESERRAFDLGASDIIKKPFEPYAVKRRVKNVVELYRHRLHLEELIDEQSASLRESNSIIIEALSSVIEYRSLESGQHIRRIRLFTKILLEEVAARYREYGLNAHKINIISDASSMHDIGKIAIPDKILNKPGRLTPEEFEIMKSHSIKGCEILKSLDRMSDREYLKYAYNICRYHHERWDGKGYPDGLKGDSIPICAQVVAVADCYDALTTDRVYKSAIPQEQAFNMILNGECGSFSPKILKCFVNVKDKFASLSNMYADGHIMAMTVMKDGADKIHSSGSYINDYEQSQMKLSALLRYMNSNVMEVDVISGIYNILYMTDENFSVLENGNNFEESIEALSKSAVHPEDREIVLGLLGKYMRDFFDAGLMKRSRRYRVMDTKTGGYVYYQATMVRVDLDNPRQKRIMIIWDKNESGGTPLICSDFYGEEDNTYISLLDGKFKCRNDRWFTINGLSQGFLSLTGYSENEIRESFNSRLSEIIYKPDMERLRTQLWQQAKLGRRAEVEYRLITKGGNIIWVMEKSVLSMDKDGEEYFYCVITDITKYKQENGGV